MYKKILYKKAYRQLENTTPLKYDCGLLCQSKCCFGNQDMGMQLFPGEETFLANIRNFLSFRKEHLQGMEILFAVCKGSCIRKYRPLACRIYPFAPYLDASGHLQIIKDPRAQYTCPILFAPDNLQVDPYFIRRLKKVFQLLLQDTDIHEYVQVLSTVLDEYRTFTGD